MTIAMRKGDGMQVEIKPGTVYLWKKCGDGISGVVRELDERDWDVLFISTTPAADINRIYGLPLKSIVTLTEAAGEGCVEPENLMVLTDIIAKFTTRSERRAIVIEGLDELKSHNDFAKVLSFIGLLYELIAINRCMAVMTCGQGSFDKRELAYMDKEAVIIEDNDRPHLLDA